MLGDSEISCGVRDLMNFRDYDTPEEILVKSFDEEPRYNTALPFPNFAFILFSDIILSKSDKHLSGTKVAKFITDNSLGVITASPIKKNPNTGNKIRVWLWELNRAKVAAWYKERSTDDDDDYDGDDDGCPCGDCNYCHICLNYSDL